MNNSVDNSFLGILMLDTNFERIIGDAGNIDSYDYPVRIKVVKGADSKDIVKDGLPSDHLVQSFIYESQNLESEGAKAIISTCGFLINAQKHIANSVDIPVMVSALSLFPKIKAKYRDSSIGIITASKESLGDCTLKAANIKKQDVHITGMEDCIPFVDSFLKEKNKQSLILDEKAIEAAVVAKATQLQKSHSNLSSFLLECGNLPPYSQAIQKATGLPVYSILNAADAMMKIK